MSEFKPITTQEEFERRLSDRLEQKERSVSKKYEGYISPEKLTEIKNGYEGQITTLNGQLETALNSAKGFEGYTSPEDLAKIKKDYDDKIAKYENDSVKTRVAIEMGLPMDIVSRLKGSSEEEIREDAKIFSGLIQREPPLASGEPVIGESKASDIALKKMIKNLKEE